MLCTVGLHVEERDQIGEEEGLVGDARSRGEGLLEVGAGLLNGQCDQGKSRHIGILAGDGFVDRVDVSAVVAEGADEREQAAPEHLSVGQGDVLLIDALGQVAEAVGEISAEVEELQLFGGLLAAAHLAQVVHDAFAGSLAEVLFVAEEGEVGFPDKGGQHAHDQGHNHEGRAVDEHCAPDQGHDGLLEEAAHLLDHGQTVGCLDPGPLQAVVELGILVGGQVQPSRLFHHLDADVIGIAVGEELVGVVHGPGENAIDQRERDFGDDPPPEMRQRGLVVDGVRHATEDVGGDEADAEGMIG